MLLTLCLVQGIYRNVSLQPLREIFRSDLAIALGYVLSFEKTKTKTFIMPSRSDMRWLVIVVTIFIVALVVISFIFVLDTVSFPNKKQGLTSSRVTGYTG